MQFVIEYDRHAMSLLSCEAFADSNYQAAAKRKLGLELLHANDNNVEVALFESENEGVLRRTHARYFRTIGELADSITDA